MKKILLSAAVVFAAVVGAFCYSSESRNENEMSDLAKANVKALAGVEFGPLCIAYDDAICHIFHDENPPLVIYGYEAMLE